MYTIYLHFRFPQPLVTAITSIQSLLLCKLLPALPGGRQPTEEGFWTCRILHLPHSASVWPISSCSSPSASAPAFWASLGHWLQHKRVGEQSQQKKSKTGEERRGHNDGVETNEHWDGFSKMWFAKCLWRQLQKKSFKNVQSNSSVTTVRAWLPKGAILKDNNHLILWVMIDLSLKKFIFLIKYKKHFLNDGYNPWT